MTISAFCRQEMKPNRPRCIHMGPALLLLATFVLAATLAQPAAAQPMHSPAPGQSDNIGIQANCTAQWSAPISEQAYYFPDLNAVYWYYRFSTGDNGNLAFRVKGEFAYARYTSFNLYMALNDNSVQNGHLSDVNIAPDEGSVNPYQPGVNRYASNRSYTLWLAPENSSLAEGPNIMTISADSATAIFILRVYRADDGYQYGGVPLPIIEAFDDNTGEPVNCPSPLGDWPLSPLDFNIMPPDAAQVSFFRPAFSGMFDNGDSLYLAADLAPAKYGQILVLRFYPPTFLDTYQHPEAVFAGDEEVRYMSLCLGHQLTTRTSACVADDQFMLSSSGYFNVVVGPDRADVRAAAAARGYNFMAWGSVVPALLYRQIMPAASFAGSITRVPFYSSELPEAGQRAENFMGAYAPVGKYCSVLAFVGGSTCGMPAP